MFRNGGEALKPIPAGNKGLPNLPKEVRNRMGYMEAGGAVPPAPMKAMPPVPEAAVQPPMMPGEEMAQTLPEDPMRDTLAAVQQNLATLDEADNAEDMINAIRGNELPLEARYAELAEFVGPEDAKQTPESVLALVQPTILMSLDEGIGALAQEEMDVPVEGPMAGGIMSTVAPPADPGPPMPMPMGAPPANFNQGGLVRRGDNQPVQYFQDANPNRVAGSPFNIQRPTVSPIGDLYDANREFYQSILGDRSAELEEQKRLARSQMLFDLARTGLAFAAPMANEPSGLSPAQRLALAAQVTELPQNIAKRGSEVATFKRGLKEQEQKLDLAAAQAAQSQRQSQLEAAQSFDEKLLDQLFDLKTGKAGEVVFNPYTGLYMEIPDKPVKLSPGESLVNQTNGKVITSIPPNPTLKSFITQKDVMINGIPVLQGTSVSLSDMDAQTVNDNFGADALVITTAKSTQDFTDSQAFNYFIANDTDDVPFHQKYRLGQLDPNDVVKMDSYISMYTTPTQTPQGGLVKKPLPPHMINAIRDRVLNGLVKPKDLPVPLRSLNFSLEELELIDDEFKHQVPVNPDGSINKNVLLESPTFIVRGVDLTAATGFSKALPQFFNPFAAQLKEIGIGSGYAGDAGKITKAAEKTLERLATRTVLDMRAGIDGRVFASDITRLEELIAGFAPGTFNTDINAYESLEGTFNLVAKAWRDSYDFIEDARQGKAVDDVIYRNAIQTEKKLGGLLAELFAAKENYRLNIYGDNLNRITASGATSNLPRVGAGQTGARQP
jgi:hypothetical protein